FPRLHSFPVESCCNNVSFQGFDCRVIVGKKSQRLDGRLTQTHLSHHHLPNQPPSLKFIVLSECAPQSREVSYIEITPFRQVLPYSVHLGFPPRLLLLALGGDLKLRGNIISQIFQIMTEVHVQKSP